MSRRLYILKLLNIYMFSQHICNIKYYIISYRFDNNRYNLSQCNFIHQGNRIICRTEC